MKERVINYIKQNRIIVFLIFCIILLGAMSVNFQQQINSYEMQLTKLSEEIEEKQSAYDVLSNKYNHATSTISDFEDEISSLESRNANLIEQRDEYKKSYNDLEENYKKIKNEYDNLKEETDSSSSSNSIITSRSNNDNDEGKSESTSTSNMVWISETGEKYHNKPNCGRMNPDNAYQMSRSAAEAAGYDACSKCF